MRPLEEDPVRMMLRGQRVALTDDIRARAQRAFHFALGRFGSRIGRVTVRLTDLNGPRGGVDKLCRVEVTLRPKGRVLIEELDSSVQTAIDRAADRAARAVDRTLERERELDTAEIVAAKVLT